MRTLLRVLALPGLLITLLAGCGPPNRSIVGTWRAEGKSPAGTKAVNTITYGADGTLHQIMKFGDQTVEIKGKYTAAEGRMSQTIESVMANGKPGDNDRGKGRTDMSYTLDGDRLIVRQRAGDEVELERVKE